MKSVLVNVSTCLIDHFHMLYNYLARIWGLVSLWIPFGHRISLFFRETLVSLILSEDLGSYPLLYPGCAGKMSSEGDHNRFIEHPISLFVPRKHPL